jgi:peptide/nickel transport system substrate-binding protein
VKLRRQAATTTLAFALGALSLAGCTGAGESPDDAGTLRIAVLGSATLDPARADTADQLGQVALAFDPLVRVDRRTQEPRPGLAARWDVSDDQTRFTFTLQSDRFHDGAPVTAADVKASLDRLGRGRRCRPPRPSWLRCADSARRTTSASRRS